MAQKTTLAEFENAFPELLKILLDHAKQYNLPQNAMDWFKKVGRRPRL